MSSVVNLFLDPTGLIFPHLSLTVNHGEPGMAKKKKKLNMSENMDTHGTFVLYTLIVCISSVRMFSLHCCFIKIYTR